MSTTKRSASAPRHLLVIALLAISHTACVTEDAASTNDPANPGGKGDGFGGDGPIAYRASILHFLADPGANVDESSYQYLEDGLLVVEDGHVVRVANASDALAELDDGVRVVDYRGKLIVPGFVDTHVHYPQTDMIASFGEQLLQWLDKYTFPTERLFANKAHAEDVAAFFLDELLRNGTTTALVFATVHPASVDAFFEQAQARNLRMIAGKVLMDRNAPDYLLDDPDSSYDDSRALIEKWHHRGRLLYAVTPRFAPTSTPAQLEAAGRLVSEFPDVYLHTHVAENQGEVAWVADLYPDSTSYMGVYDDFGLVKERAVFAHAIHLEDSDYDMLATAGAAVSFCPTSNLFLGSGLFDLEKMRGRGVRVGMGTDVGAGTSFSMFQTMNEAYKVSQLRGQKLSPFRAMYLATLGGAESLYIDDKVGNFEAGKEADFVVIDLASTPLIQRRMTNTTDLAEKLFVQQMLGDDRAVHATYVLGQKAYSKADEPWEQH